MPRWLKWAIVTLPLVVCVFLWASSFLIVQRFERDAPYNVVLIHFHRGSLALAFQRQQDRWDLFPATWDYRYAPTHDSHLEERFVTRNRTLGFGYESWLGPSSTSWTTIIEGPMWVLALVTALPPLWLYRRHRKHRKGGFPVEPITASSKE